MPTTEVDAPIIETGRLELRLPGADDAEDLYRSVQDWEVVQYTSRIPFPYERSMADSFIDEVVKGSTGRNLLILIDRTRADGRYVGQVGLEIEDDPTTGEISYLIGRPFWNQGYASEMTTAIVRYGFEELGYERIMSRVFIENAASNRVMEKLGFILRGQEPLFAPARDRTVQVYWYDLRRDDWKAAA